MGLDWCSAGFVCLVLMVIGILMLPVAGGVIGNVGLDVVTSDLPLCLATWGIFVVLEMVLFLVCCDYYFDVYMFGFWLCFGFDFGFCLVCVLLWLELFGVLVAVWVCLLDWL